MADAMEQWFSWQEDIYSQFPQVQNQRQQGVHWAASLWPGPMRPASRMLSQISDLGRSLQHPALRAQLPLPPVFDHCSRQLSPGDEAAAVSLYWSVIQLDQSEEHTSELQSPCNLVCRLLLEKKKKS